MEQKKELICTRDLTPDTCFLCEQEDKDYCMICADTFTKEEYQELYKKHTWEITVSYFNQESSD